MQKSEVQLKIKTATGMTLIETLVAITILLMAVVGPMVIYSRSITDARYAGNRITAYYLAQEALEFVKYKVNTEFNSGVGWFSTLPDCSGSGSGNTCCVDSSNGFIDTISSNNCNKDSNDNPILKVDSSTGFYNHSTGNDTIFARTVKFDQTPDENGGLVSSTVAWTQAGVTKSIKLEEYMFRWR